MTLLVLETRRIKIVVPAQLLHIDRTHRISRDIRTEAEGTGARTQTVRRMIQFNYTCISSCSQSFRPTRPA